jgi:ABC-2 type transport system permease protein
MTAPVSDWDVVLSKYLAVVAFYLMLWSPTLLFLGLLRLISVDPVVIPWGSLAGGGLMVLLVGMLYGAIGILASALTRNQIIAAVMAFSTTLILFSIGFVSFFDPPKIVRELAGYISTYEHMDQCVKGLVSSRVLVFYVSVTALLLVITQKVVESRRWRA